ncbi:MAG: cob(I)yrinic acid a,c-diamide adenosyltransferase [Gemmatimonadetes bacterium]|nr:cob(I)yrinic acid a,c-diamide adenosyltransferase [Gemmatimonadota bacterium]
MAIYTKTGDDGDTSLFGGGRVPKNDRRVEAYGAVDELNSFVGLALTSLTDAHADAEADPDAEPDVDADADADPGIRRGLLLIQNDLFALGANLATPERDDSRPRPRTPDVPVARVEAMERWIDRATEELPELREFILPGGTGAAAMLHVCRSVCRRAERAVVALGREETLDPGIVRYLNRLSDLFFVWARLENLRAGQADVPWSQE